MTVPTWSIGSDLAAQIPQWISLLYRRVQKIEQIQQDHCEDIKTTALKNAIDWHWSHTSDLLGTLVKFH